jgi:hypothetical protein
LKNGGLQILVKMNLKRSIYGPEHKTKRLRSIEVIVNFWKLVGNIGVFLTKTVMCSSRKVVNEIYVLMIFFFLKIHNIKLLQWFWLGNSAVEAGESWTQIFFFKNHDSTNHSKCRYLPNQHIFGFFLVFGIWWTDSVQKLHTSYFVTFQNLIKRRKRSNQFF